MLIEIAMASAIQLSLDDGISVEKWEECLSDSGARSCPLPAGAPAFKACLDESETAGINDRSVCDLKAFPECYPQIAPKDTRALLRLCGAKFSISARWVAEEWIADIRMAIPKDEMEAFEVEVTAPLFSRAYTNISDDPLEASTERSGSWGAVLFTLKTLKNIIDSGT